MFWWKHEIKNCSCWWIMILTFWSALTKLNDIDNHHSWSSLQVWMPNNKYRQVDLIFQWHIRPTDGIQHVAEYLFCYWPMSIMKWFFFWIFFLKSDPVVNALLIWLLEIYFFCADLIRSDRIRSDLITSGQRNI